MNINIYAAEAQSLTRAQARGLGDWLEEAVRDTDLAGVLDAEDMRTLALLRDAVPVLAEQRDAAVARAEEAEREAQEWLTQSAMDSAEIDDMKAERDRYRAALAELGGDLEATAASPGKAYVQGVTEITTWREAEDARDAAREVGGE